MCTSHVIDSDIFSKMVKIHVLQLILRSRLQGSGGRCLVHLTALKMWTLFVDQMASSIKTTAIGENEPAEPVRAHFLFLNTSFTLFPRPVMCGEIFREMSSV